MLLMHVRQIKADDSDYTMSVPLSILPGLNADFDGKQYCHEIEKSIGNTSLKRGCFVKQFVEAIRYEVFLQKICSTTRKS